MTHTFDPRSPTSAQISAVLIERARRQAPVPLQVACGLGGGGEALARALLAVVDAQDVLGEVCVSSSRNGGRAGVLYAANEGAVVDQVACSDVGPSTPSKAECDGSRWSLVLVRDRTDGDSSLAELVGPDTERRLFCELLREECAIPDERAAVVSDHLGCPTALIPELRALQGDWSEASTREIIEACWTLPLLVELREHTLRRGGRALLDLGRVLCLMNPPEIELSDEWSLLAGALSSRSYAVSDVSSAINACPGLFDVSRGPERALVRPSSLLASQIFLDGVPPSTSEHFALYRALRDRCVGSVSRGDVSDRFVARQLPRQARAADALADLAADPLAILSSDPITLLRELEAQPERLRAPAPKMISLAAHRLMGGEDRESQLELSARRMGLHELADRLASQGSARRWRPLWAQAQLPNVHRVALSHRAPLLALAAMDDREGSVFVGCADGEVWRIAPYGSATCLSGSQGLDGEIRALAACSSNDQRLVAVGTSTHAVGILDGASGDLQWLDRCAHKDPLSAVTISAGDRKALISSGVGGLIYAHPLLAGEGLGEVLHDQGSEIRGLETVRAGATDLVVFSAVNGRVGLVRCADGVLVAQWHLGEVLNSVAASVEDGSLRLVTGTSEGNVRQLQLPVEALDVCGEVAATEMRCEEWQIVATHRGAVNSVRLVQDRDGFAVLSAASDGLWQWDDGRGMRQSGVGHVGPIWSIVCTTTGRRRYVVSAGGEGSCRLWLTEAVLGEGIEHIQPLARRSPVTAIGLAGDPAAHVRLITGGNDGDVRIVAPELTDGGELLARHDSEIFALLSVAVEESHSHVISGSIDGTLRLTPIDPRRSRESSILGIAHDGVTTLAAGVADNDRHAVSGGIDGTITVWDLHLRTPERTVQGSRYGGVQALCHIHERGEAMLVVGGQDGGVSIFHPLNLEQRGEPLQLDAGVLCMCPLPGPVAGVIAGLDDGRMAVVREPGLQGPRSVSYAEVSENEIRGLGTLILGGRMFVACAGLDRRLRLLDLQTGARAIDIELDGFALSLSAVGISVAVGTSAGAAVISYASDILALRPHA